MNKKEIIEGHGVAGYKKHLERNRQWCEAHPEKVEGYRHDQSHKGGKRYEKALKDQQTGIPGEKNVIRSRDRNQYKPFKDIIAPESELHHNWDNDGSAGYSGVALVEKDAHRHGVINVIQILEGEITLFTEEEVRNQVGI